MGQIEAQKWASFWRQNGLHFGGSKSPQKAIGFRPQSPFQSTRKAIEIEIQSPLEAILEGRKKSLNQVDNGPFSGAIFRSSKSPQNRLTRRLDLRSNRLSRRLRSRSNRLSRRFWSAKMRLIFGAEMRPIFAPFLALIYLVNCS